MRSVCARRVCLVFLLGLFGVLGVAPAAALADGAISGTVTDGATGAAVAKIDVTLITPGGGFRDATTATDGTYAFSSVPDGTYHVAFEGYGYVTQYYNDTTYPGDPITVSGADVSGIDAALEMMGRISGTVTDAASGAPVKNVEVDAYLSGEIWTSTCTAADGTFTLSALTQGSYAVAFSSPGSCRGKTNYATQFYEDKNSRARAHLISVSDGTTVPRIDAAMQPAGQITGTVTDAAAKTPIQDVEVDVYDSAGNLLESTCSAADGTYTLGALGSASYRVGFTALGTNPLGTNPCNGVDGNYVAQFYDGEQSLASADPVAVTGGSTTSGIDAAMAPGGQIAGTVTDAVSNSPIVNIEVGLYDSSGDVLEYTCTEDDGTYSFASLPSGSYRVGFDDANFNTCSEPCGPCLGGQVYADQFYSDESDLSDADPVAVTVGETTSGIDAKLAMIPGQLNGTVTDADTGGSLSGVSVTLYDSAGKVVGSTTTDGDGDYGLLISEPGEYRVGFAAPGFAAQFYRFEPSLATADEVEAGPGLDYLSQGIDAALTPLPGEIAGTVTDAVTGKAVAGATVSVYDGSAGGVVASASTDAAGNYQVSGVAPGSYQVGFSAPGYASVFYDGEASLPAADPVTVASGSTTPSIDAALTVAPGQIAGRVIDTTTSAPLAGATVDVYDSAGVLVGSASTDAAGAYQASGLAPGVYRVAFTASGHVAQFYDDEPSLATADAVTVTAGATTAAIDAALDRAAPDRAALDRAPGQISGTVTDAGTRAAIAGASVSVYGADGTVVASAMTSAAGAYLVSGLAPGSYWVAFAAPGHVAQFYDDKPSFAAADPVSIAAGSIATTVDAALAASQRRAAPAISRLRETHRTFRAGMRPATFARDRPPLGTTFTFAVSAASTVRLVFTRSLDGRNVKGRCVAARPRNRDQRRCRRHPVTGSLRYRAPAGPQTVRFTGRLSAAKTLGPGHYQLTLQATNAAGHSRPHSISFTIIK